MDLDNLSRKYPTLDLLYNKLCDYLGIDHGKLRRALQRLKSNKQIPRTFMPKHTTGRPTKDDNPYRQVLTCIKQDLKKINSRGINKLTVSSVLRLIKSKEEEVLYEAKI